MGLSSVNTINIMGAGPELSAGNIALIIGHPGHELRIFRFIEIYKPRVYVLTDGSGSHGVSRIHNTAAILEKCGATLSPVMGYFTDMELYKILLQKDYDPLFRCIDKISYDLQENAVTVIAGDAIEGYNPTHDLCRYMINHLASDLEKRLKAPVKNFDFLLDGLATPGKEKLLEIRLDDADFERKYKTAESYQELAFEVKRAVEKYGREPFKIEYLREVNKPYRYNDWEEEIPFYEKYAEEKVASGVYHEVVSFKEHVLPFLEKLSSYVELPVF